MNEKSITSSPASQDHTALDKPAAGSPSLVAETVEERLKRIYPEHFVRIITAMNRQNGPEHTVKMLSRKAEKHELDHIFLWSDTAEGRDFWAKLSEREH